MKPRELFYMLGLKPAAKTFGFAVKSFDLPADGALHYAQWQHPAERDRTFVQEDVDELRRYLSPGDVAIDVGAHSGDSTLPIALAVGIQGCVLAFEPNRYVFPILEENARLNSEKTNIIPLMYAAALQDGSMEFEYSDAGFCNGGRHEGISKWRHGHAFKLEVEGRNLEKLVLADYPDLVDRFRYIKIDTEGYDASVLRSISGLVSRCKPYIKAEMYKKSNAAQRAALYHTIADHGYELFKVESEADYRGQKLSDGDLMKWSHFDVFCVPTGA